MTLVIPAPAKLNLFLHIIGKADNGYHRLQTIFQLLDYGDSVELTPNQHGISLCESLPNVPDTDNLVFKAAQLLAKHSKISQGVKIKINKNLPMGGGLGGGSSNAASTLLGLNQLWQLGLSLDQLAAIGLQLGADVPVFIRGQNSFAEGIGEQLQAIKLPKCWFIVIKPPVNVSTAKIFAHPQLTRDSLPIRMAAFFSSKKNLNSEYNNVTDSIMASTETACLNNLPLRNDCETVVRQQHPEVEQAFNWLAQHSEAHLTGTGSCIFAAFDSKQAAEKVFAKMPAALSGFIARSSDRSLAHKALNIPVAQ